MSTDISLVHVRIPGVVPLRKGIYKVETSVDGSTKWRLPWKSACLPAVRIRFAWVIAMSAISLIL